MYAEPSKPDAALTDDEQARLWLSACADGEAQAVDSACRLWRGDPAARQMWHRYHLIGDVMRSAELATSPASDAAFFAGLRQRLSAEPVILAPTPSVARPAWRLPAAMAASFILIAGAFAVARLGPVTASGETAVLSGGLAVVAAADVRADADGAVLITDPRLDEFLRAHQATGGGLRRVEGIIPAVSRR